MGAIYGLAPLFWVAGWLSGVSVSRHGSARFARSRLVRLGLPAVLFWALIDPLSDWLGGVPVCFAVGHFTARTPGVDRVV